MYIADSLEEQDANMEPGTSSGASLAPVRGGTASATMPPPPPLQEEDAIERMLSDEIEVQREIEEQKKKRVLDAIEQHERETQEEAEREAQDDEARWQQHLSSMIQIEDDETLRRAMGTPPLKKRVRTEVAMVKERIKIQVQLLPDEVVDEDEGDASQDLQTGAQEEKIFEQEDINEGILRLAEDEYPEAKLWTSDVLRKSWFVLWKAGNVKDEEVENRWGVDTLLQFQEDLTAQLVEICASQRADELMSQTTACCDESQTEEHGGDGALCRPTGQREPEEVMVGGNGEGGGAGPATSIANAEDEHAMVDDGGDEGGECAQRRPPRAAPTGGHADISLTTIRRQITSELYESSLSGVG